MGSSIADIITTKDLSVEDTSELKTGNTRRSYNMAIHQGKCPPGSKRYNMAKTLRKINKK